jgi:hypothetical protein
MRGERSSRWKGGRRIDHKGYVLIFKPDYPGGKVGGKYVMEHKLVMEEHLGRRLRPGENVHHKNGVRHDNRLENLELWNRAQPIGQRQRDGRHCETCTCALDEGLIQDVLDLTDVLQAECPIALANDKIRNLVARCRNLARERQLVPTLSGE